MSTTIQTLLILLIILIIIITINSNNYDKSKINLETIILKG